MHLLRELDRLNLPRSRQYSKRAAAMKMPVFVRKILRKLDYRRWDLS